MEKRRGHEDTGATNAWKYCTYDNGTKLDILRVRVPKSWASRSSVRNASRATGNVHFGRVVLTRALNNAPSSASPFQLNDVSAVCENCVVWDISLVDGDPYLAEPPLAGDHSLLNRVVDDGDSLLRLSFLLTNKKVCSTASKSSSNN